MYLVSSPSHSPLAVFDQWDDAERYLCQKAFVSVRFSCLRDVPGSSTMRELYVGDNGPHPRFVIGYITEGIEINPQV